MGELRAATLCATAGARSGGDGDGTDESARTEAGKGAGVNACADGDADAEDSGSDVNSMDAAASGWDAAVSGCDAATHDDDVAATKLGSARVWSADIVRGESGATGLGAKRRSALTVGRLAAAFRLLPAFLLGCLLACLL